MNQTDDLVGFQIRATILFDLELDACISCPAVLYENGDDRIIIREVEDVEGWKAYIDKQLESNRSNTQLYSSFKKSKYEFVIETLNGNRRFNEIRMWLHFILIVVLSWNMIFSRGMNIATGPNSSRSVGNTCSSRRFQSHRKIILVDEEHLKKISTYLDIILKKAKDKLTSIDAIRLVLHTIVSNQLIGAVGTSVIFYFTIIEFILVRGDSRDSTYKASMRFAKIKNDYKIYSKVRDLFQQRGKLIHNANKCFLPEDQAFLEESTFDLIERFIIDEEKFNDIDKWLFF